jgi:hypothetical protein
LVFPTAMATFFSSLVKLSSIAHMLPVQLAQVDCVRYVNIAVQSQLAVFKCKDCLIRSVYSLVSGKISFRVVHLLGGLRAIISTGQFLGRQLCYGAIVKSSLEYSLFNQNWGGWDIVGVKNTHANIS